jgi:hypothetical protein
MTWRKRKSRMSSTVPEKTAQDETAPGSLLDRHEAADYSV